MKLEAMSTHPAACVDSAALIHRSDLLFCLARAFLPPPPGWSVCDWAQPLADDLAELGASLGFDTDDVQSALTAECERWAAGAHLADGSADPWLVEYARLFLMPPVAVPLNTGIYLEGGLGGVSSRMMLACYETAGVVPDESFHDLPDHVAMQLEFVADLLERAAHGDSDALGMADEFSREFIHAWAEPLEQACRAAGVRLPAAQVYTALTRLMRAQAIGNSTALDQTRDRAETGPRPAQLS